MVLDPLSLKLGKGPVKTDPRTLRLSDILTADLPPIANALDNSAKWHNMGILGNDTHGDCVVCAYANLLDLIASSLGGSWSCSTTDVVYLYFARTGGVDAGLVILDFLKWAIANFWLGKKVLAFASIDPRDMNLMALAITICGGVFRGIELPQTAQGQVGRLWDFLPNTPGNQPGSWGGHATLGVAYDFTTQRTKDVTWGALQEATFTFWRSYQSEAYAIITEDTPLIDRAKLEAELQQIGQYVGPSPTPPPPPPPAPVVIIPAAATVQVDGGLAFRTNTIVSWRAGRGSIGPNGVYTAPHSAGPDAVTATDGNGTSAVASITVVAAPPPPPPPTGGPTFMGTATDSTGKSVDFLVRLPALGLVTKLTGAFVYADGKKQTFGVGLGPARLTQAIKRLFGR